MRVGPSREWSLPGVSPVDTNKPKQTLALGREILLVSSDRDVG